VVSIAVAGLILSPVSALAATSWVHVVSPNVGGGTNFLDGVSCVSASACTAIGNSTSASNVDRTLVQSWNGASWSHVSSPNVGTSHNDLNAVSCVPSTTYCTAVGEYFTSGGVARTLILSRHGSTWSHVVTPNVGTNNNGLFGVSCVSASRCVAVGSYFNSSKIQRTLIEMWNGTSWKNVSSPNVGTHPNELLGVSCPSSTRCIAVGYEDGSGTVDRTLVESWNGSTWSHLTTPNVGTHDNDLLGVSCTSTSRCMAVGAYRNAANIDRTLAEQWNGTSWSHVTSPNVGTNHNVLFGVSCPTTTSCTAAGQYRNASNIHQTLIESWNGTSWTHVSSPNVGTKPNELYAISCVKATTKCTAVGFYDNTSNVDRTLIESHG
jgi:hypothetical protein